MRIYTAPLGDLSALSRISIAFTASSIMEIGPAPAPDGGCTMCERSLAKPLHKDYDAIPGNHPSDWLRRFDTRSWALLLADMEGATVGAALIASATPEVQMLEHPGQAVLWDLRVAPDYRGRGCGTALFSAARNWCSRHGYAELKIETQNTNPAAVKFYLQRGCVLRHVQAGAYPEFPDELMLLFYIATD